MQFPRLPLLACVLLLQACASLSEEECRRADWRVIGYGDGAEGRLATYISEHREACAKVGVRPNLDAWMAGRERGLREYCVPERVFELGKRGKTMTPVCPRQLVPELQRANLAGLRHHEIGEDISALERDRSEVEKRLSKLASPANDAERNERERLARERSRLERRISQAREEQSRYAYWP